MYANYDEILSNKASHKAKESILDDQSYQFESEDSVHKNWTII